MTNTPWLNDACSLVEAFRKKERNPSEELAVTLVEIEQDTKNSFSFIDPEFAAIQAKNADITKPFGGVPTGVKELESVKGWPDTKASLAYKDRVSEFDSTSITRLKNDGGAVLVGLTTASEFGGLNVSVSRLNGVTGNAWDKTKTAGGSSGGSASAVASGIVPIATGGDGGGSIRIPAGFNGLLGMKGTAGRIPRGPHTTIAPLTVVIGCLARSVRDAARWYDVCSGYDMRDPYSLPKIFGWEQSLDSYDLSKKRVAILPNLDNSAFVRDEVASCIQLAGEQLAKDANLTIVDNVSFDVPGLGMEWAMSNLASLQSEIDLQYPEHLDEFTAEMAFGFKLANENYNLAMASMVEKNRTKANEAMASAFDHVDFIICATNPDVAYEADCTLNMQVGGKPVGPENNGALTIPANIVGNPAISIPVGFVDGLPVGMQIMARHHEDALLFDLARFVERERPWPLVAPRS